MAENLDDEVEEFLQGRAKLTQSCRNNSLVVVVVVAAAERQRRMVTKLPQRR